MRLHNANPRLALAVCFHQFRSWKTDWRGKNQSLYPTTRQSKEKHFDLYVSREFMTAHQRLSASAMESLLRGATGRCPFALRDLPT